MSTPDAMSARPAAPKGARTAGEAEGFPVSARPAAPSKRAPQANPKVHQ